MKYIVLLLSFFSVISVRAQRLIVEDGNIYIEAFGVRSDLVSPIVNLKQVVLSDGTMRTPYHQGIGNPINVLMLRKFQIAKRDAPDSNLDFYSQCGLEIGYDGRPGTTMKPSTADPDKNWGCDNYSEKNDGSDKGKWRVPTINECLLMASFITSYKALSIPNLITPSTQLGREMNFWYMSSTTDDKDVNKVYIYKWYPAYHPELVGTMPKDYRGARVRCVRDLEE